MDLLEQASEKLKFGESLLAETEAYAHIDGASKLQRKIRQEIAFLRRIAKSSALKSEHLQCSNLTHFAALVDALRAAERCTHVGRPFALAGGRKLLVDIVADGGATWLKVIARNARSLRAASEGDASFGVRSVVDQARDYAEGARLHPHRFAAPRVVFVFANGVDGRTARRVERLGVGVRGEVGDERGDDAEDSSEQDDLPAAEPPAPCAAATDGLLRANLDVSAMLAYVSSVTNGGAAAYTFPVRVLAEQARSERARPVRARLDAFLAGRRLFCCRTARDSFLAIVRTVGGERERARAAALLRRVAVLPDDARLAGGAAQLGAERRLALGGKIRARSLAIFAFGDRIGAVTVTSNDGFVRSARQQGVEFVVFVHESRALTEQKEQLKGIAEDELKS